jgi:hypothetical protein
MDQCMVGGQSTNHNLRKLEVRTISEHVRLRKGVSCSVRQVRLTQLSDSSELWNGSGEPLKTYFGSGTTLKTYFGQK